MEIDKAALVYVPTLDRFLIRRAEAGGEVLQLDPTTLEVSTLQTTGGEPIPETVNGPYNKFLFIPALGGIVYVPTHTGNAWFLRLTTPSSEERPVSPGGAGPLVFTVVPGCQSAPWPAALPLLLLFRPRPRSSPIESKE